MMPMSAGPCRRENTRYYYDVTTGQCVEFTYSGCGGNRNNFRSQEACVRACGNGTATIDPEEGKGTVISPLV